jgi:NAD(P)-dependent dehydrogenase (short-subunit alcohol dehydrogenase family)
MTLGGTVMVTGAARGLGLAIAERFLTDGVDTLVLSDVDRAQLETAAESLSLGATKLIISALDVSDRDAVVAAVDEAVSASGRLDVLVNNAGVLSPSGRLHNLAVEDWTRCFNINVMGAVNGIFAAVPHMRTQGGGAIVNTASAAGITPFAYAGPYSASKAAVISVTQSAALEYARDKIRVNCVCPGTFLSAIHQGLDQSAIDAMAAKHPLGLGQMSDVVGAFAYLAGPDSAWTTGASLVVDGGYTVQ